MKELVIDFQHFSFVTDRILGNFGMIFEANTWKIGCFFLAFDRSNIGEFFDNIAGECLEN